MTACKGLVERHIYRLTTAYTQIFVELEFFLQHRVKERAEFGLGDKMHKALNGGSCIAKLVGAKVEFRR